MRRLAVVALLFPLAACAGSDESSAERVAEPTPSEPTYVETEECRASVSDVVELRADLATTDPQEVRAVLSQMETLAAPGLADCSAAVTTPLADGLRAVEEGIIGAQFLSLGEGAPVDVSEAVTLLAQAERAAESTS